MDLQQRFDLMVKMGQYMKKNDKEWMAVKEKAVWENAWFIPEFTELATTNICTEFLDRGRLAKWVESYTIPDAQLNSKTVGVVMAGNIPMVGFHDFLCVFMSGHQVKIKVSSKDETMIKHLVEKMYEWEVNTKSFISFAENLKGCDAYIATGSNNSGRYFNYYFGKYPNIIRRNKTSVAILDGTETKEDLDALADDVQLYFGLGCRNVTKLYVPMQYDFIKLLDALKKYDYYTGFHKYTHNLDYHLALLIMGNKYYMNNGSVTLTENASLFSPVSQVNYEYYDDKKAVTGRLTKSNDVQCIVGNGFIPFGHAQKPSLKDYADGADTMQFLLGL